MIVYWGLFAFVALGSLAARGEDRLRALRGLALLAIVLLVGLRFDVGADWETYRLNFRYDARLAAGQLFDDGEPLYRLLSWGVAQLGGGIIWANLIGAAIFGWGLARLAGRLAEPWTALVLAVPYLVIVVAMGYTRQSIAIGIIMAGLAMLLRGGGLGRYLLYVIVAAMFHRSAVLAFALVLMARTAHPAARLLAGVAIGYALYASFIASSIDHYVRSYLDARYESQGASIRVLMSLVPGVLLLATQRRLFPDPHERSLWRAFAIASVAAALLLFVLPSTTAVDRLALYLLPLQLAVFSSLPRLAGEGRGQALRLQVVAYAAAIQFVWLNFAVHAQYWLPYQAALPWGEHGDGR